MINLPAKPGVYRLVHVPSGMTYVGQSVNVAARVRAHLNALRRGTHDVPELQRLFTTDGETAFTAELVRTCDEAFLDLAERRAIAAVPKELSLNRDPGGRAGPRSPATRAKVAAAVPRWLTDADAELARALLATGDSVNDVADLLAIPRSVVTNLAAGRTYRGHGD